MYLINKDETEHTGQVSLITFIKFSTDWRYRVCSFHFLISCCVVWNAVLTFSVSGVICLEDVPGALLGLLSCWRLFQKAVWGSAFLANKYFTHTEGKGQLLNFLCSSFLWNLKKKRKKINSMNIGNTRNSGNFQVIFKNVHYKDIIVYWRQEMFIVRLKCLS